MTDKELANILDEVSISEAGLSLVLGVPRQDIEDWCDGRIPAPKWFVAYMSMVLSLQKVGRIAYGEIGNPYE